MVSSEEDLMIKEEIDRLWGNNARRGLSELRKRTNTG